MTALLNRPTTFPARVETAPQAPKDRRPSRRTRVAEWIHRHRRTLRWLTPIVALGGLVQAINLGGSPARIDDEGTYTAQAWAVTHLDQLTHYTYWYDHPPLGWLQIAAWTSLTGGFQRYAVAVVAAREAMVVATLISIVLLWLLARRVGLSRPAAGAAAIVFAISPLAVQFHRTVYLDNVATPWLLASLLLAMTRRKQLFGFAASGAALGIAVLSKETYLLALPLVAWLMWRNAHPQTRRYTISVAASILVLIGGGYILLALVKGELLPSPDHTSLVGGVLFQLGTRESSGSILDPSSLLSKTLGEWFQLDPIQVILAPLAAIAGLFVRRIRPFAVALLALVLIIFRPGGYLPVPYVIMMLPLAALVIAGVGDDAIRHLRKTGFRVSGVARRIRNISTVAVLGLAVLVAAPAWTVQLRGLLLADLDQPSRQAEQWVEQNVPKTSRLLIDDSMWVDLVKSGFARDNVIWFYKLDTDKAVEAQSPRGWRDSDYVVTTNSMKTSPNAASADKAIANSTVVASFGTGTQQVQVRRINPDGASAATAADAAAAQLRMTTGTQVITNPQLTASSVNIAKLRAGQVDPRIALLIGQLATEGQVALERFPVIAGETGEPFRQVVLTSLDGHALTQGQRLTATGRAVLSTLGGPLAAQSTSVTSGGLLITFSIDPATQFVQ